MRVANCPRLPPVPELRKNLFRPFVRLPARSAVALVRLYQLTISPALAVINPGCGCRFTPTCSHYAIGAWQDHGLLAGSALTLRRLGKCAPWHAGGLDPVPARRPVCAKVSTHSPASLLPRSTSLS